MVEWSADCNNDGIVDYGQIRMGQLPDFNDNNIPDCCEQGVPCVVDTYPVEWRVSEGGNGHLYRFYADTSISWTAANAVATSAGGFLADLESASEADWIVAMLARVPGGIINQNCGPFIGAYQQPGADEPASGWMWTSGRPWSNELWHPGDPNNNACGLPENFSHLVFVSGTGRINDIPNDGMGCGSRFPGGYLVEWSADCNNDGAVDYGQILRGELADANADGIPDVCQAPSCRDADLFRDGQVNGADLAALLSQWGPANTNTVSDINHDGVVDGFDLSLLLSFWGPCSP
jgi:hypothetical protein